MNATGFHYHSAEAVMDEIAGLVPTYSGISYQRLEQEGGLVLRTNLESPQPTQVLYSSKEQRGIQWPCTLDDASSTATLYSNGFPKGKADPITPEFRVAQAQPDPEFPVWLVPGRVLLQRETQMQVVKGRRNQIIREDWVELNPEDAATWSIAEGEPVEVVTRGHRLAAMVRLVDSVPPGVVATTNLFGQLAVDLQASEEMDPASKVAGLDITAAIVIKVGAQEAQ